MVRTFQVDSYFVIGGNDILVDEFSGNVPDEDYVDGWIELTIGSKKILGKKHEDLIDQLWGYLIDGLRESICENVYWESSFPDQPLRMTLLRKEHSQIEFCIGKAVYNLCEKDFSIAITTGASRFFLRMIEIIPSRKDTWAAYIGKCKEIESCLDPGTN